MGHDLEMLDFYMNHLLDFPGKMSNLRLALLHGFGGIAKKTNARILLQRRDKWRTDQPLYVVVVRISTVT